MVNYKKSIIYKLCCKNPNITDIYVGSTTNFNRRKQAHKSICNNENAKQYNNKVYKVIRQNGGFNNWDMIQIEKYECEEKRQLHTRERYYIETLNSSLNCNIPTRTKTEYEEQNKDKVKQKIKEWRDKNKEKTKEYNKEYNQKNKDKKKEYLEKNKNKLNEYHIKYRQNNKEKRKQQQKEYRQKNKEIIKQKAKEYYQKKKLEQANN